MKELRRSPWALTLLIVLCASLAAVALRAAAQSLMSGPRAVMPAAAPPSAIAAPAAPAPAAPAPPAKETPAPPPAPSAGAIRDEPELAPDKKESADNNVSFPVDI